MSAVAVTPFRSFVQTPIFSVSPSSLALVSSEYSNKSLNKHHHHRRPPPVPRNVSSPPRLCRHVAFSRWLQWYLDTPAVEASFALADFVDDDI